MPDLTYNKQGLVIKIGGTDATAQQIMDLQRDLRQLGYLNEGIDGAFGNGTERAIMALQYDLLHNDGKSTTDGDAPVAVRDYNKGRVTQITGEVDQDTASCISDMLDDQDFLKLPKSANPAQDNQTVVSNIKVLPSQKVPTPFLMAICKQESDLKQYNEQDSYILTGLDRNGSQGYIITSRGYGAGQYTLFHHPPRNEEVDGVMNDVQKNVQKAITELREKFDNFICGDTSVTTADDRIAEYGDGDLRLCQYTVSDPRYMNDCKQCMTAAGQADIQEGVTPLYEGSSSVYEPTQYYASANYSSIPIRKNIPCDWPYAARRYNGSGMNSYHYQVRILRNVLNL